METQELSRFSRLVHRSATVLVAVGAAAMLVFGDRPSTHILPNGKPIHQRVVVSYWEEWTGFEGRAMRHIVNKFNMSQHHIYINMVEVSSVNIKTLIAAAGGDPPDLVTLWSAIMGQFISYHALTPLNTLVRHKVVTPHTFVPFAWKLCAPHGILYGLPATTDPNALYWNKILFARAGLDPNKPPTTLQQLGAMAKRLTISKPDGTIQQVGFLPMEPNWYSPDWGIYFGNHIYNCKTGHFNIDTPQQQQAYRWFQSFSQRLGYRAVDSFQSGFGPFNSPLNPFMDGHVAMELQGPFLANFINRNNPKLIGHYGVAPFPTSFGPPGAAVFGDCDVWVIPRGAQHVHAALAVLKYFIAQKNLEYLNDQQAKPSPLLNVSRKFIRRNPNPYIQVFETLAHQENVQSLPPSALWPRLNLQLTVMANRIWMGASVTAQLRHAQSLANQWVRREKRLVAWRRQQELRP
ncbi:MAG: extracellular solute-binding protein [Phycisphaerae bacterium]